MRFESSPLRPMNQGPRGALSSFRGRGAPESPGVPEASGARAIDAARGPGRASRHADADRHQGVPRHGPGRQLFGRRARARHRAVGGDQARQPARGRGRRAPLRPLDPQAGADRRRASAAPAPAASRRRARRDARSAARPAKRPERAPADQVADDDRARSSSASRSPVSRRQPERHHRAAADGPLVNPLEEGLDIALGALPQSYRQRRRNAALPLSAGAGRVARLPGPARPAAQPRATSSRTTAWPSCRWGSPGRSSASGPIDIDIRATLHRQRQPTAGGRRAQGLGLTVVPEFLARERAAERDGSVALLPEFPIVPFWFKAMVPRHKADRPEVSGPARAPAGGNSRRPRGTGRTPRRIVHRVAAATATAAGKPGSAP